MTWLASSIILSGLGFIIGLGSYLVLSKRDERSLQAISFALVSTGSMVGFDAVLTNERSDTSLWALVAFTTTTAFVALIVVLSRRTSALALNVDDRQHSEHKTKAQPNQHRCRDSSTMVSHTHWTITLSLSIPLKVTWTRDHP